MGNRMRILSALLIIAILFGCTSLPSHIVKEDGKYYMIVDGQETGKSSSDGDSMKVYGNVYFDSYDEMIEAFMNKDFSKSEWNILSDYMDDKGRIRIPPVVKEELLVYTVPSDITSCRVGVGGHSYHFRGEKDGLIFTFSPTKQDSYDAGTMRVEEYKNKPNAEFCDIDDRNATQYCYDGIYSDANGTRTVRYRHLVYTFVEDGYTYLVDETYISDQNTPLNIRINGCKNSIYFDIYLERLNDRPSMEWLSKFKLEEA